MKQWIIEFYFVCIFEERFLRTYFFVKFYFLIQIFTKKMLKTSMSIKNVFIGDCRENYIYEKLKKKSENLGKKINRKF